MFVYIRLEHKQLSDSSKFYEFHPNPFYPNTKIFFRVLATKIISLPGVPAELAPTEWLRRCPLPLLGGPPPPPNEWLSDNPVTWFELWKEKLELTLRGDEGTLGGRKESAEKLI